MKLEWSHKTKLVNTKNSREHWAVRAKRTKQQREAGRALTLRELEGREPEFPCVVTITRCGPRLLDEGDNANLSCSPVRDGIADALGRDDADPGYTWQYCQEKQPTYSCKVTIESEVE